MVKGGGNYIFCLLLHCISKAYIKWTFANLYITPGIQICTMKPEFSLLNSLSDVIYSKSFFFSLKHVQCSRIRLNSDVSFITFSVHVYKIL